jgi:hypothetical protein
MPEYRSVRSLKQKALRTRFCENRSKNFQKINTPAATKVLLWTKAEIGVGADMADGSQEEKGNWALLVKVNRRTNRIIILPHRGENPKSKFLRPHKDSRKKMSPTRFL